jgi:hypothetical protein
MLNLSCLSEEDRALSHFKKSTKGEFDQCVGATGSIDYQIFIPSGDKYPPQVRVIELNMLKNNKKAKVQYLINIDTRVFDQMPTYVEIDGEAKSVFSLGLFCMP